MWAHVGSAGRLERAEELGPQEHDGRGRADDASEPCRDPEKERNREVGRKNSRDPCKNEPMSRHKIGHGRTAQARGGKGERDALEGGEKLIGRGEDEYHVQGPYESHPDSKKIDGHSPAIGLPGLAHADEPPLFLGRMRGDRGTALGRVARRHTSLDCAVREKPSGGPFSLGGVRLSQIDPKSEDPRS